jgi:cell wall-associated NlpC family hydrolase
MRRAALLAVAMVALGCGATRRPAEPRSWASSSTSSGAAVDPSALAAIRFAEAQVGTGAAVDPSALAAIRFAEAQVGKRYCWGGTGPSCFDCSGLVQAAWRWAGVKLPRTSEAQGRALAEVPLEELRPGDILWWRGHVGLYVGGGEMIDAYHSRAGVVRRPAAVPERVLRVRPRELTVAR